MTAAARRSPFESPPTTRRKFLTTASLTVAGTLAAAKRLSAEAQVNPVSLSLNSPLTASTFLRGSAAPIDIRALALHAIDAAKGAGASYADVRVAERHSLVAGRTRILLYTDFTYGVRALADGAWGFAYGRSPRVDDITRCARDAAAGARISARISGSSVAPQTEWIPAPVATGEWTTPIEIDPFTVPIQQQAELQEAIRMAVSRVPGVRAGFSNTWTRETRVFASTTGSLLTQTLHRTFPDLSYDMTIGGASFGSSHVDLHVPTLYGASVGYEMLLAPDFADRFKAAAEDAMRLAKLPRRPLDVGRYPVVFDGTIMGNLLVSILGRSLELDRVLGNDADASGTSKFTLDRLGTPVASPLLTLTGHRKVPSITAVQWDDEGNVPQEHAVIRDGVLMDYHTSSDTVSALTSWYANHQRTLQSNGCAVAPDAEHTVTIRPPHLTMTPGANTLSLADLLKDMDKGIVVLDHGGIRTDQQLASGSMESTWGGLFEVSRGQIVRRLLNMGLQFNTLPLLKSITAVGDRTTVCTNEVTLSDGMPWIESYHGATAPATLFKEINVISNQRA